MVGRLALKRQWCLAVSGGRLACSNCPILLESLELQSPQAVCSRPLWLRSRAGLSGKMDLAFQVQCASPILDFLMPTGYFDFLSVK